MSGSGAQGEIIIAALRNNDPSLIKIVFEDLTPRQVDITLNLLEAAIKSRSLKVTQIDLTNIIHMTSAQILRLAEILSDRASPVDSLYIEGAIEPECLNAFALMLLKNPKFKTLSFADIPLFSSDQIDDVIAESIGYLYSGIMACKNLQSLDLQFNYCLGLYEIIVKDNPEELSLITVIESLPRLQDLNVSFCGLTDNSLVALLSAVKNMDTMKILAATQTDGLTTEVALSIAAMLRRSNIETFVWHDEEETLEPEIAGIVFNGAAKSRALRRLELNALVRSGEDFSGLLTLLLNNRTLDMLRIKGLAIENFSSQQISTLLRNLAINESLQLLSLYAHAWTAVQAADFIRAAGNLRYLILNVGKGPAEKGDLSKIIAAYQANPGLELITLEYGTDVYADHERKMSVRNLDLMNERRARANSGAVAHEVHVPRAGEPILPIRESGITTTTTTTTVVAEELSIEKQFVIEYWKEYVDFMSDPDAEPIVVTLEQKARLNPIIERTLLGYLRDNHFKSTDKHKREQILDSLRKGQVRTLLCITHNNASQNVLAQEAQVFRKELAVVYGHVFPFTPVAMRSGFEHISKKPRA